MAAPYPRHPLPHSSPAHARSRPLRARQLPVGVYDAKFPLVSLIEASATAKISMGGSVPDMDYISRHLRTEAVFNRGLRLKRLDSSDRELNIECSGKSERMKSFVRWCYLGPALTRPDRVKVTWSE